MTEPSSITSLARTWAYVALALSACDARYPDGKLQCDSLAQCPGDEFRACRAPSHTARGSERRCYRAEDDASSAAATNAPERTAGSKATVPPPAAGASPETMVVADGGRPSSPPAASPDLAADSGTMSEPDDAGPPPDAGAASTPPSNGCSSIPAGSQEALLPDVEDLGLSALALEGLESALPGPAAEAYGSQGRNYWLLGRTSLDVVNPDTTPANRPVALVVVSLGRSSGPTVVGVEPFAGETERRSFVALDDASPRDTELWPSTIAWSTNLGGGLAYIRRVEQGKTAAVSVARIALESSVVSDTPVEVFTGDDPMFSTGSFTNGNGFYLYLYACAKNEAADPTADERYGCSLVRTPIADAQLREGYEAFAGRAPIEWSKDLSRGTPVLFGGKDLTVHYSAHIKKLVAIHLHPETGKLHVQTSGSPWGPWQTLARISLPEHDGMGKPITAYQIDTNTQCTRMIIAYAVPEIADPARTHLHLAGLTWQR